MLFHYGHVTRREFKSGESLVESGVRDVVKLHPEVIILFKELLRSRIPSLDYSMNQLVTLSTSLHHKIHLKEHINILGSLEECHLKASILPNYLAMHFYKIMVKKKKLRYAFIGHESFSDIDWMFLLSGIVPPSLVKNIHRISESGVWQWWMELIESRRFMNKNVEPVRAASMRGNIVIIFIVRAVGILISVLCILLENVYYGILCQVYTQITQLYQTAWFLTFSII